MDPVAAVLHYNKALELERLGHYEEAVEAYRKAVGLDVAQAEAHVRLGVLLRHLGRDEEANLAFEAALAAHAARGPGPWRRSRRASPRKSRKAVPPDV